MKANKLVVELFSLAILSGCLISCSKTTKEANTQSMQNMKINKMNSNSKSNPKFRESSKEAGRKRR